MLINTLLIFFITFLGYSEWLLGTSFLQRPIILGPLVGLVLGDVTQGIIMGATLELAMVGAVSVGAYNPPDLIAGTVLGVSLAIQSHAGPAAALTLGIPVATIMLAMNTAFGQPVMLLLIHRIDKNAAEANTKAMTRNMLLAGWAQNWCGIVFIPLAFYFGSAFVTKLLGNIPDFIQTGMNIAAGLLPALGFAMLAQMIMNKKVAAFFFIGFFIVAYGGISTTGVAIFATLVAIVMYIFIDKPMQKKTIIAENTANTTEEGGFDEF
ncbi:PTS sugar transporter subunit IIC [Lactobacillus sp. YT155]|uniref:PTS mannose/fructose/sorbose/N-acetylgalactosamine transporter subunit IIC n=1 Tax=Lactobacillus sp. YT155 TaxID=3060955 RepID=UPI00265FD65C|nr:PTS sugar transporter subunit IIC [Lactobacillus sp. YT155]MDO1605628.1 PTS sugar transporter subunit IIC [Lactobacillus sp. YT155]